MEEVGPRRVLSLAASAFLVLAAEPLYLLVDTAVVGHLGGVPLAGLGVAATLMAMLAIVGTFVQYGTTGRAARWYGAGRVDAAVNEGVQASWLAVGIGAAAIVGGQVLAGPLTHLLAGGPGEVQAAAEGWLRIALFGLPGVFLVLAGTGWMRGVQQTRQPVIYVLLANGLSALASPVLVYGLDMGLNGSAFANVGAQLVGGALFVGSLRRQAASLRPDRDILRGQLSVGRDLILRQVGFQAVFLSAAGVAARISTASIAAHQIGMQLWVFTALVLDSFAIAAQSLIGAALGGSDASFARRTAWQVARYGLYAGIGSAALFAAGWAVIPRLFTSAEDVVQQAHVLWPWLVLMMPVAGVLFALDGVLIGAGDVAFMRNVTVVAAFFVFVPLAFAALRFDWGLGGVWAALAAFIAARFAAMAVRTRGSAWLVLGEAR